MTKIDRAIYDWTGLWLDDPYQPPDTGTMKEIFNYKTRIWEFKQLQPWHSAEHKLRSVLWRFRRRWNR